MSIDSVIINAILSGDKLLVEQLIKKGANFNARGVLDRSLLILAAGKGYSDIVDLLLDRGANINDQGKYGLTALMLAAANRHTQTVKLLVDRGAYLRIRDTSDRTALMHASNSDKEIIQILEEGLSKQPVDEKYYQPSKKCERKSKRVMKTLEVRNLNLGHRPRTIIDEEAIPYFLVFTTTTFIAYGLTAAALSSTGGSVQMWCYIEQELFAFINIEFDAIQEEVATGRGQHLMVLSKLIGCREYSVFKARIRAQYQLLFTNINKEYPEIFLSKLRKIIVNDDFLKKTCFVS